MTPSARAVYRRLLSAYGPQGWWPVTLPGGRAPVYRPGHQRRLSERQRAEVCVGAILTQNTSWKNVERALMSLHAAGIRDLRGVGEASSARLQRLIRSSGYFRQKAKKLKAFARHFLRRGGTLGGWLSEPLPKLREELLGLWGIGPETADSIILYAGGRNSFVIDAYTLRIGRRLGWFRAPGYDSAQRYLVQRLSPRPGLYGEFHALMVALAKNHCRSRPLCRDCPLLEVCRYGRASTAAA